MDDFFLCILSEREKKREKVNWSEVKKKALKYSHCCELSSTESHVAKFHAPVVQDSSNCLISLYLRIFPLESIFKPKIQKQSLSIIVLKNMLRLKCALCNKFLNALYSNIFFYSEGKKLVIRTFLFKIYLNDHF